MAGRTLLCALITVACWIPVASQAPAAEAPPKNIFGLYGAAKAGRDSIRVTAAAQGKVAVALKLYYANGHTCALNREGEWHGDHVSIDAEGITGNEPCRLEASFPGGRILLKDEAQRCARVYCGTRGKLDGVSLPKRSSAHE